MDFCKHKERDCKEKNAIFRHKKKEQIKQKCAIIQPKCWKFHSHSNRLGSRDSKITHGKIWILKPISNGWFWTKMTTFDLVFIRPRILHTETTSPEIVRFLLPLTLDKVIILIEFYKVLPEKKKMKKKNLGCSSLIFLRRQSYQL